MHAAKPFLLPICSEGYPWYASAFFTDTNTHENKKYTVCRVKNEVHCYIFVPTRSMYDLPT